MHEEVQLRARGMTFAALAWGPPDGPLALCLHGYPDTPHTWRHLGPYLAARGWRVVAPYTRGYAPTSLAPDGDYRLGALAADAAALHAVLGGDERAVLVGHDWGAATAYALGAHSPGLFRRMVTLAVPPIAPSSRHLPLLPRQLRLSWYMGFQLLPGISERSLGRVIPKLWRDWSPGYDASEDLPHVFAALGGPGRRTAALRYYRAFFAHAAASALRRRRSPRPRRSSAPTPVLFLYGDRDGCLLPELSARAAAVLSPPSRAHAVGGAGHFLHLERPEVVNPLIEGFACG